MARPTRTWPVLVTFLAAIAIEIMPLPDVVQAFSESAGPVVGHMNTPGDGGHMFWPAFFENQAL